jgi:hypothetical protein
VQTKVKATTSPGLRLGSRGVKLMDAADNSADYYRMRRAHQIELALSAESERIRRIHLELAERYQQVLDDMAVDGHAQPAPPIK